MLESTDGQQWPWQHAEMALTRPTRAGNANKRIKEINEKDTSNPEEFKFSEMDKSNDKSSTRYDAKFIEDDELNYDPEIVTPSNTT